MNDIVFWYYGLTLNPIGFHVLPGGSRDELGLDFVTFRSEVGDTRSETERAEVGKGLIRGDAMAFLHIGKDALRLGDRFLLVWIVVVFHCMNDLRCTITILSLPSSRTSQPRGCFPTSVPE